MRFVMPNLPWGLIYQLVADDLIDFIVYRYIFFISLSLQLSIYLFILYIYLSPTYVTNLSGNVRL